MHLKSSEFRNRLDAVIKSFKLAELNNEPTVKKSVGVKHNDIRKGVYVNATDEAVDYPVKKALMQIRCPITENN